MYSDAQASGVLIVDLDALARNYAALRRAAAPADCGAVVKANAYGLGLSPVARRLLHEGCRNFFVATLAEGLELRELAPRARIFVLEGVVAGAEPELAGAALVPVLNSLEQVERWSEAGGPAALHLDTGMTRLGLSAADVATLARDAKRLRNIEIECVMTHLACADEPEHSRNADQLAAFDRLRSVWPQAKTSIGNSAGAFLSEAHRGDLVRAGIALYGGNPFIAEPSPVEEVVALKARILQVRTLEEPATIGYGATYAAEPPARIAVVGIGYADGYPRSLGNSGIASVGGVRVPVVGRVSMDLACLDVSAVPAGRVREGMFVDLIGGGIGLDEVAAAAGTISYEILTRFGARLKREYRGEVGEV
ncbi:MAG TPA: alanine racemase [Gammaproteobacteria bacterium]|jgi:alanine racemase